MFRALSPLVAAAALLAVPAMAQDSMSENSTDSWLPSLMAETPAEGFDLAITMARKAVTTTQTDKTILHALRPNYAHDPQSLIDVSGVVAVYFDTIAQANDYWRD